MSCPIRKRDDYTLRYMISKENRRNRLHKEKICVNLVNVCTASTSRSSFQCVSSRISVKRFNELSCQSKVSALFKSDDLIKRFMISKQSDVDTYWILQHRSPIICDESSRSTVIENVESWRRFELLSCTLWRILDVWDTDQIVTTSVWQTDRVYDRTVFRDVYFLAFQVRQINSEFCWPRQERLFRDFLDKKSET